MVTTMLVIIVTMVSIFIGVTVKVSVSLMIKYSGQKIYILGRFYKI